MKFVPPYFFNEASYFNVNIDWTLLREIVREREFIIITFKDTTTE